MCRMLATLTNDQQNEKIYRDFLPLAEEGRVKPFRSKGHTDGWGIAGLLTEGSLFFYRSPNNVLDEKEIYFDKVKEILSSGAYLTIVHFRKASSGSIKMENTHPFVHDKWIFAHNGSILETEKLKVNKNFCKGDTDSEKMFNFIIENITQNTDFISSLIEILKYLNSEVRHTSYTFFLANPEYLIAYREYSTKFAEEGDEPSWNRNYYTLYYTKSSDKVLFCSQPVGNEKWMPMKNSQLIVVHRNLSTHSYTLSKKS